LFGNCGDRFCAVIERPIRRPRENRGLPFRARSGNARKLAVAFVAHGYGMVSAGITDVDGACKRRNTRNMVCADMNAALRERSRFS